MKKLLKSWTFAAVLLSWSIALVTAQPDSTRAMRPAKIPTKTIASRLEGFVLGGSLGLGYSNGWTTNLSPSVGYRLTDKLIAGVGIPFLRSTYDPFPAQSTTKEVYQSFGTRAFLQQLLIFNIYAHAEYEYLKGKYRIIEKSSKDVLAQSSTSAPGVLLGGGYNQGFGFGAGFYVEVLYNILHTVETPYADPWVFRFGFTYGF